MRTEVVTPYRETAGVRLERLARVNPASGEEAVSWRIIRDDGEMSFAMEDDAHDAFDLAVIAALAGSPSSEIDPS